jgi:hypothetical protein
MSRPKLYDGPPISVRLPADLQDDLCREALRRDVDVSRVIRERLWHSVYQNAAQAQTSAQ